MLSHHMKEFLAAGVAVVAGALVYKRMKSGAQPVGPTPNPVPAPPPQPALPPQNYNQQQLNSGNSGGLPTYNPDQSNQTIDPNSLAGFNPTTGMVSNPFVNDATAAGFDDVLAALGG